MLSLRVFTAIASQKLGVLLIPVFSPLCYLTWLDRTLSTLSKKNFKFYKSFPNEKVFHSDRNVYFIPLFLCTFVVLGQKILVKLSNKVRMSNILQILEMDLKIWSVKNTHKTKEIDCKFLKSCPGELNYEIATH